MRQNVTHERFSSGASSAARWELFLRAAFPVSQLIGIFFVAFALAALFAFPRTYSGSIWRFALIGSTTVNDSFLIIGSLVLLFIAWRNRSKALFIRSVGAMLGETVIVHGIKGFDALFLHLWSRPSGGNGGFPSGHASAACTMAYLLTDHFPQMAPIWYALAAWIAWSRRDAGAHYDYQIIGGTVIGLTTAIWFVLRYPKKSQRTSP